MAVAQKRSNGTLVDRDQLDYELGRRGISGKQLATRAGMHESVISRARRHPMRPATLRRIAEALLTFPIVDGVDLLVTDPKRKAADVSFSSAAQEVAASAVDTRALVARR